MIRRIDGPRNRSALALASARRLPAERTDPSEPAERSDAADPAEPIENAEPSEPIDPIESTEPDEPIERTESSDPIERIESVMRLRDVTCSWPWVAPPRRTGFQSSRHLFRLPFACDARMAQHEAP